jgi:magnesium-transporting ATPase (P-type)
METQKHIEERLWDYIDGTASTEERSVIEKLLQNNMEWKNKYRELLETHQLLQSSELDTPSLRFTKNVMEEIAKYHIAPATKTYINKRIIWGIGLFFITIIIGFLVYGFGQIDWTTKGDNNLPIDLSKVDISKFFNNTYVNIFMMINVVLGLFLLDNYFSNKRKAFRKKEA